MAMSDNNKTVVSRRDFLKGGAVLGAATVGASVLSACAPSRGDGNADIDDNAATGTSEVDNTKTSIDYETLTGKSAAIADRYDFKYLNQPGKIGNLEIKNRIIKSGASGAESEHGVDVTVEFYRGMTRGGVGMIIMPGAAYTPTGMGFAPIMSQDDIPQHTPYTEAIHEEGGTVFLQFGDMSNIGMVLPGMPLPDVRGSSTVAQPGATLSMNTMTPRVMTTEEVEEIIGWFKNDAPLVKQAGYDGIEINSGSTHLLADFTSRFFNRDRTDKYSDESIENLGRLVTDLLDAGKEACGTDYPIGVLINGHEMDVFSVGNNERCNSIELQCELAKLYEAHGADYIHVRSAAYGTHYLDIFPDVHFMHGEPDTGYGQPAELDKFWPEFIQDYRGAGAFMNTAAKIKEAVSIPVIVTGMMDVRLIPDIIDNAIGESRIDFIGVTRRIYADPEYAKKALSGDIGEIRPCANCVSCWHNYCRVNTAHARAGSEEMPEGYTPTPAVTPKNVLIAGGGPAGLEAAHIAAERGHQVTIYEKGASWGGLTSSIITIKGLHEKIQDHIDWLVRQCEKQGVTMETEKDVTKDVIAEFAPDVLIVATGGKTTAPDVPGIDNPKVVYGTASGEKIAVIGGQIEGIETAIYLAKQGKEVTVLEQGPEENLGLNFPDAEIQNMCLYWCETHGIKLNFGITIDTIDDTGITFTQPYGLKETLECDNVVIALPRETDATLLDEVKDSVAEAYAIGNSSEYGLIREAVRDGNLLARRL
jgi:2,4-dienoyl-CoA reductase-like NADH-dependent reductase (Old Yellow Enzyme family)/thioredoxin reductase